jgi:hypothetical protein
MKPVPYLSVDIETTGLDKQKSNILQLAAVWDDGGPLEQLKTFDVLIDNGPITYGEPYALALNAWIFEILGGMKPCPPEHKVLPIQKAREQFLEFVYSILGENKFIYVAGKNAARFDLPILENNHFSTVFFSHVVIDPGLMYFEQFGFPPGMNKINSYLGAKQVSHKALEDCFDVVRAVRSKFKSK